MEKWENPELLSENRLEPHTYFEEDRVSLNGRWRFLCVNASQPLPDRFYEPTFSSKQWDMIAVPSSWEKAGYCNGFFYGDRPNPALSSKERKSPSVDSAANLIGIYRKRFLLPDNWSARKIILRFHDVRGCFSVWLNGQYIGMSKGSLTPVEFDITANIQSGYNYICLQVSQYSDANYLDDPGKWVFSGILGDVDIYALPQQCITDLYAQTTIGTDMEDIQLRVDLSAENADGMTARIAVMEDNQVLYYGEGMICEGKVSVLIPCRNAKLWSCETPYLYRIAVILWDGVAICHTRQLSYGFRTIEIRGTTLMLNGHPLTLKGVCYSHTDTDTFESDIQTMKASNINAVRVFSPICETFYDLCDQYGLYILADCATEQKHPLWKNLYQERSAELIKTHRNHPSILIWNLSGDCENLKALDPLRPVCNSDLYCSDMPSLQRILQMERTEDIIETPTGLARVLSSPTVISAEQYSSMPLLALRYGGMSGNSAQQLCRYADIFQKSEHWCGGFFYNFKDLDLYQCQEPRTSVGLVRNDGTPHHILYELQKAYQWIDCQRNQDGSICIRNHYTYRSTQEFQCSYQITRDGHIIDEDILELNIPPKTAQTIRIPMPDSMYQAGRYHLAIFFKDNSAVPTTEAATAYFQWELANNRHLYDHFPGGSIRDDNAYVCLKAENVTFMINRSTGNLDQIQIDDQNLLTAPLSPIFYRVKTDAELSAGKRLDDWAKNTLKNQIPKPSVVEIDHMSHQVTVVQSMGSGLMRHYQLNRDGSLTIEFRLRTGKTAPNCIGMQGSMDISYNHFSWIGTGPWDTYADRNGYGLFGIHRQLVEEQDQFLRPQEHGNKTDVIQMSVTNENGHGLLVKSEEPIECSVLPYSTNDLQTGDESPTQTVFRINCLQNGLAEPIIKPHSTYMYTFTIKPVAHEE